MWIMLLAGQPLTIRQFAPEQLQMLEQIFGYVLSFLNAMGMTPVIVTGLIGLVLIGLTERVMSMVGGRR